MKNGPLYLPRQARIAGSGSFLPGEPIPRNLVDTYLGELTEAPQKIRNWLGRIREIMSELLEVEYYHFALDPVSRQFTEDNVSMSVKAALKALEQAGAVPRDVELIVYGSAHQDQMPTASVRIQEGLGIDRCAELSIHANCTSAYKSLLVASDMIRHGRYSNALVLSSSMSSSELVAEYYNQKLVTKEELFLRYFLSDGASALFLKAGSEGDEGLWVDHVYMESAGGNKPSAMGNKRPAYWMNPREEYEKGYHHLAQMFQEELRRNFHEEGGSVFLHGLERMLKQYPLNADAVRFFQVNFPSKHISELVIDECSSLGIRPDSLYTRMSSMGYLGPPMAFVCLDQILREEHLSEGDLILSFVTEVSKFMQAGYVMGWRKI
jgi:3-oxoacyl-[acyl-carrier-protein] synthase III